jgi:mannose-6-phosphate isomerase-like protein (cupin superfamily)
MEPHRRPKVVQAGEGMRLNVQVILFTYKARSEDTDGKYALTEGVAPPHRGAPTHIHHREDEALYILDGDFEIECGGKTFHAGPGTFALLPKNLPHRFQNLSVQPGKVLCVQSPGGVEEFFEHMSLLAKAGPPDPAKIRELTKTSGHLSLSSRR